MGSISNGTYGRASMILDRLEANRILDSLQNENVANLTPCHSVSETSNSCDNQLPLSPLSMNNENMIISCDLNDIVTCLFKKLIAENNFSKVQFENCIEIIKILFVRFNVNYILPSMQNIWNRNDSDLQQEYWFICDLGHSHGPRIGQPRNFESFSCHGREISPSIRKMSYFIKLSITKQLKMLLSQIGHELIHVTRSHGHIHDIRDASLALDARSTDDTLTLTLFTDELPASKSSKLSIFPVYLMINELPVKQRQDNSLLASIFVGYKKPVDSMTFLKPIIDELIDLESSGLSWTCEITQKMQFKRFKLICVIADAPMRAYLRSVKQFNSRFACDWCKIASIAVDGITKFPVPQLHELQGLYRSKHEFLLHAQGYIQEDAVSHSIKSISPFLKVASFDLVWGFSVDIMHAIYLGIMKDIFKRGWFNVNMNNKSYFIGSARKIRMMDARIKCIMVTSEHTRPIRSLSEYKEWKANEFASFLCYFFYPILDGILPHKYLVHLGQLAEAVIMLQTIPVSRENVIYAKFLLHDFVTNLERLYGREFMTYNSHIILHLADSVSKLGPASMTSAFNSENEMGKMKRVSRKYIDVPQGIMNLYMIKMSYRSMRNKLSNSRDLLPDETDFLGLHENSQPLISGLFTLNHEPSEDLINFCQEHGIACNESIESTKMIKISGLMFTSHDYDVNKKRCNSLIKVENSICKIISIYKIQEKTIFKVKKMIQDTPWKLDLQSHHGNLMSCSIPNIKIVTSAQEIIDFVIYDKKRVGKIFFYCSEKYNVFMFPSLILN